MNLATIFFTGLCCVIFTVQFVAYIRDVLTSTDLYTEMRKVNLAKQPLPIVISICLKPGLNQTELWSAGYQDEIYYSFGMSRHNETNFGWGGHTKGRMHGYKNSSVLAKKTSNLERPF